MRDGLNLAWTLLVAMFVAWGGSGLTGGSEAAAQPAATNARFELVPYPRLVQERVGDMPVQAGSAIVVGSPDLMNLGSVLSNEIFALTEQRLDVRLGAPGSGDIFLNKDNTLTGEAYAMDVQDHAVISGANYRAIAQGTVTLLQSLKTTGGSTIAPRVRIEDHPAASYRATMVDVAREPHSLDTIKKQIELNRLYKIPYLQLHLTDDQAITLAISSVDGLNGGNFQGADDPRTMPTYSRQELQDLVKFADDRGVTIIPEIDMPGHSHQMVRNRPDLFRTGWYHHATMNIANPDAVTAAKAIVSEVADIFQSSPYIHIGGDEADFSQLHYGQVNYANGNPNPTVDPQVRQQWDDKMDQLTLELRAAGKIGPTEQVTNAHAVYRDFLNEMDEHIQALGRQTIVWEGFARHGMVPVNKDIIVMSFENRYYRPEHIVADGYRNINASWSPLYVVSMQDEDERELTLAATLEAIYAWDKQHYDVYYGNVSPTSGIRLPDEVADLILGGQMSSWEQTEAVLIESLRLRLAAMSERLWSPDSTWTYEDFHTRLLATDAMLEKLFLANDMEYVPEPSGAAMLLLGSLITFRRRSRRPAHPER